MSTAWPAAHPVPGVSAGWSFVPSNARTSAAQSTADLQKIAALTPEQQRQLVDYANLQKIAALTPDQQRQLVDYANLQKIAALSPAEREHLVQYATLKRTAQLQPVEETQMRELSQLSKRELEGLVHHIRTGADLSAEERVALQGVTVDHWAQLLKAIHGASLSARAG